MFIKKSLMVIAATSMLTACVQNDGGVYHRQGRVDPVMNKQNAGALMGAVGGAILGSNVGKGKGNIAAIAVGTLLGAGLGSSVGASLDRADMQYYNSTAQNALETQPAGQALPWSNPQSGNSGYITPQNYYQTPTGQYCREYSQTINIGGRIEEGVGRACRQPDGTWRIAE